EDRQKVVKNFCADSELAHFWLFFTPIPADPLHARIVALRGRGETIANTARLAGTSVTTVKRVWAAHCALDGVVRS
ncbi:helix-turn-helix domain-containing protein, partial [Xanthomonas citri]|uniref:helix-turn-helix domain-containing protein n=1 Tax=Xanthomonas citri TaxID=346 RepID=UPI001EE6BB8C